MSNEILISIIKWTDSHKIENFMGLQITDELYIIV